MSMTRKTRNQAMLRARSRLAKSAQDIGENNSMNVEMRENAGDLQTESDLLFVSLLAENVDLTPNQMRFLTEFAKDGLHLRACQRSGISPATYYGWARNNSEFKAALEETRKYANEGLEGYALDLAQGIYKEPIASAGKLVAWKDVRDSKMLALVMKARMPEKYGQKSDSVTGVVSPVKYIDKELWDAI